MAGIMSLKKLRNKVSRNGYDLSRKTVYTAKVGELLPITCVEVIPGDSFQIQLQSFTRTMPVNTAAYTRIREYYDYFFVPTNLLWNKFNTFFTQMRDNVQHAASIEGNKPLNGNHPYFTVGQISTYLATLASSVNASKNKNFFGLERTQLTCKLLDYLGYGRFSVSGSAVTAPKVNTPLNPFPLLAYQKIYQDFFRYSQWEKAAPQNFNLDYMTQGGQMPLQSMILTDNMFDLRYSNWQKDYFMGLLPNSQYGELTTVDSATPLVAPNASPTVIGQTAGVGDGVRFSSQDIYKLAGLLGISVGVDDSTGINTATRINQLFSVLALRQAEAKQRWAEITQSQSQDTKQQLEAHWNVNISNAYSETCTYIGGVSSNIDISEVLNNNLSDQNMEADIRGKGVGAGNGYVNFSSDVPGYLLCIYHAQPILDYAITGIKRQNLKTTVTDYAIPEFDKCGMVSVPTLELSSTFVVPSEKPDFLGYAPRYYDYKTSYDEVHGAFVNGGLQSWVAPVNDTYIDTYLKGVYSSSSQTLSGLTYPFFKVNPATLNPIFTASVDSTTATDQLLCNVFQDIKAVRSLDRDGLPY